MAQPRSAAQLLGMPARRFLQQHWQKRPLLIRQALPGFAGLLDRDQFLSLATRADAVSRLVIHHPRRRSGQWERHDGPFGAIDASMLPARGWTMLIHGIESLVPGGWDLLRRFSFIPSARVDDLMVSYGSDGGTVGPHDDQYDVFLLQGPGRKRWRISHQRDRQLDPSAAIKVLRSFDTEQEWVLEAGDMLYLPPGVAHWGIAEGESFTYSIGFLAPSHRDLLRYFLGHLAEERGERIDADKLYEDPDLRPQRDAQAISSTMVARVADIIGGIRYGRADVADFLGRFLTGQKPASAFQAPRRPLSPDAFAARLRRPGQVALSLPSRGLVHGGRIYLNGEAHAASPSLMRLFRELAFARHVALPLRIDARSCALLYEWYGAGYLHIV